MVPIQFKDYFRQFDGGFTTIWPTDGIRDLYYYKDNAPEDRLALCLVNLTRNGRTEVYRADTMEVKAIIEYRKGVYTVRGPEYYGPSREFYHMEDVFNHLVTR